MDFTKFYAGVDRKWIVSSFAEIANPIEPVCIYFCYMKHKNYRFDNKNLRKTSNIIGFINQTLMFLTGAVFVNQFSK